MIAFDDFTELYQFIDSYEHKGKVETMVEVNQNGAYFYARYSKLHLDFVPVAMVPLFQAFNPLLGIFQNFKPNKADYALAESFLAAPDAEYKTFYFEPRYIPHPGVEASIKCHVSKDGQIVEETPKDWFNKIEPMIQGYLAGAL